MIPYLTRMAQNFFDQIYARKCDNEDTTTATRKLSQPLPKSTFWWYIYSYIMKLTFNH